MRKEQSTILYLFVLLLLAVGVLLFVFKDQMASQFLNYGGTDEIVAVKTENNVLNLDILRDSRVKALKNYISVFDYQNLDKTQDAIVEALKVQNEVIISNPEPTATTTGETTVKNYIRVRVGNSNPFSVEKKAK